eukprot:GHRR01029047.1.p1 GENE.GHRR01029047.1~~GHRR01029047.1.p1  ORF type:complete len:405 (+),score=155.27 GHRR01029047.1:171-1385(+)
MGITNHYIRQLAAQEAEQLTQLEAAHVQAVLQAAIDKLSLLAVIVVDPRMQAQELTQSVGEEISKMITQQKELEQRFHELITAQSALRAMPNKANLNKNQEELEEVSKALKQATKQLCRNLKDNPNVTGNMAKVAATREALQMLLSNTMDSLEQQLTVQPVIEAVLAAEQAEAEMREMVEAEKSATATVKGLRSDLATGKQQHEEQTREQRHAVHELKERLRHEKLQLAVDARFHKKDLAAANQASGRMQHSQLDEIMQQLTLLHQQIDIERSVHAASSVYLAAKAGGLHSDASAWHSRREEDGRNKERELEMLRATHAQALERLADSTARLKDETMAQEARKEKAQKEEEERETEKALHARRVQAATTIQATWRGHKARHEAKGGKAKGKRRGASGKGKKGKK